MSAGRYRTVRVTTTVLLSEDMEEPIAAVAAALATEGFAAGDVQILGINVEVLPDDARGDQ